jgi:serine/threonine protein kinase
MLEPGTLLSSRYRIESILGQGGMGAVYLATQEALNKKVAVKEMELKGFSADELAQAEQQFNKEASFLANLDHPNLVQVTDYFNEGDRQYLVMAYVQGETLQQKLKAYGRPFSWEAVKQYAEPLVDVLHYLHTQDPPILFRDLKPSNVMVEPSGRLRLIDFGIARTAQAGDRTSTFLQGTGTSGFSPIEQYGGGQSTDQRSDIYALGATLYYLLTGKLPPDAVARISQGKELIPACKLQPSLPAELDQLLGKSMALRQQDRHGSMVEFRHDMMSIRNPEMDPEGATEDFGFLPPAGGTTQPRPEPSPVKKAPAIMVEMYPTTSSAKGPSQAPWIIGAVSMAVASFAVLAMFWSKVPKNQDLTENNSPVPAQTVNHTLDTSVPRPLTPDPVIEVSPDSSESEEKTEPKPRRLEASEYNKPLPLPSKQPVAKPEAQPQPKPKPTKKPSVLKNKTNYPTASYPRSNFKPKPEPKPDPKPAQNTQPVRPISAVADHPPGPPPDPNHPYANWKRGDPLPLDPNGRPFPIPPYLRDQIEGRRENLRPRGGPGGRGGPDFDDDRPEPGGSMW